MKSLPFALLFLCMLPAQSAETVFNFSDSASRLAADSGPGSLGLYDPQGSGWGAVETLFGTPGELGVPPLPGGGSKVIMQFPACTASQGYLLTHGLSANGYFSGNGLTSDYTLVMDVLFPEPSPGAYRGLLQTNPANSDDTDLFIRQGSASGIGISRRYHGTIAPGQWHRIAVAVRAAASTGRMEKYIDGRFVGAQGTGSAPINQRWALGREALLFTDDTDDTTRGYCSSIRLLDRCLTAGEIAALGGVSSSGTQSPGAPPPPQQRLARPLRIIGHRGAAGVCPENTLPSIQRGFSDGASVVEMDVRLSADAVPVLMHDTTVDRTTDASGAVNAFTLAQLQSMDAGSWFSADYAGVSVPSLAQALAAVPPGGIAYLDLKLTGMGPAVAAVLSATGFSQQRTWIYAATLTEAAALRSALPDCPLALPASPSGIEPDAATLALLRSLNVVMLAADAENGDVDAFLSARLREEGIATGCYPLMGPEAMHTAVANTLEAVTTDYPGLLASLQPVSPPASAAPDPPPGAQAVSRRILAWQPAAGATAQRVHFGTENPPPLYREQSAAVCTIPQPLDGVTYWWRVDAVTPGGIDTGPLWTFTGSTVTLAHRYEWNFSGGALHTVRGNGVMSFRDADTAASCTFETTDGVIVPHPGGAPAAVLRVPALPVSGGIYLTFPLSGPNGGGTFINRCAIIMDILSPGTAGWAALFNTNISNTNDADWFIDPTGRLGIGALGYTPAGTVTQNTWHRLALSADLSAGSVKYFVNGTLVHTRTGTSLRDTRHSIPTGETPEPDLLLFNEGGAGDNTHELFVANIAFADNLLSDDEIIRLGGPGNSGIFGPPATLAITDVIRMPASIQITWPPESGTRLQSSRTLQPGSWTDIPGTDAAGSWTGDTTEQRNFYRLFRP